MPTRRLSTTTTAPPATMSRATTSSTQRVGTPPCDSPSFVAIARLLRDEAGFLHQHLVLVLGVRDPIGILLAGHERLVERGVLGELLPFGRLADFLQHVDVIVDLLLRDAAG